MEQNLGNRWRFVGAALIMQLCLGVLYSWSVFRGPLEALHGWDKTQSIAPYRWSVLMFTVAMIFAGFWQDKKGPRLVGSVGGILLGTGCLLASFIGNTPGGMIFAYGVLGGLGVGFAYVTPIATCVKWFPDKRGMIVGLAVMGFGAGSLIFAPLIEKLIGSNPDAFAQTIPRTFIIMAITFYICVIGAAQVYKVPPVGYRPPGWSPPATAGAPTKEDYSPGEMIKTWQFYVLWIMYFLGTSVGITAIGQAKPIIVELSKGAAVMSGGAALGIMSLFNGVGRLAWGTTSDKIGRNMTTALMYGTYVIACLFLLRNAQNFWQVLIGLCVVGFSYGGYLALMPSFTADYFGAKNVGANYGILFTAWGICGFVVPGYFAGIMKAAKAAGNVAGGYNKVYFILAMMSIIGAVLCFVVKRPVQEVGS
ncbi:MAG: OFA family MFS transporter [bacterium]|nr:OFA family MFS transporter [bacterium]MDT8395103.1 OFA family MFS transporter [bacterium]